MNKQPEITQKTRRKLIDAFWKLYKALPIEKITIKALVREAGYNHSTFYEYFEDIYDMRRKAEDELVEMYDAEAQRMMPNGVKDATKEQVVSIFIHTFELFGDRLMTLAGEHGDPGFQDRLEEHSAAFMNMMISADVGDMSKYIVAFEYNAISGILRKWYSEGMKLSKPEIMSLIYGLMAEGSIATARSLAQQKENKDRFTGISDL